VNEQLGWESHVGLLAIPAHTKWYAGPQIPARQEMPGFNLIRAPFLRTEYLFLKIGLTHNPDIPMSKHH